MNNTTTLAAGIDTAKDKLDIAVHGQTTQMTVANTPAGYKQLAAALTRAGVSRVGIEATGGYERAVVHHLRAADFTVLVLQPLQVKAFARLRLRHAKNDALDAAMIAACTAMIDPAEAAVDARLEPLADQLTFVAQVEEDIARLKNRLEHITDLRLRHMVARDIARFQKRRATEMARIVNALHQHDDLARRFSLIRSVPGIGERTALAIVVYLPELGGISREQVAALAGLAPFDDDSGLHKGQRHIHGGRSRLRRSLYAAALPAAFLWNPALKALYARLIARGRTHKAALVACARKLLIFANTVVLRGSPWKAALPSG